MSRVQPRAPSPSDSAAAAGAPAAEGVGAAVGARASAEVAGVVVGEFGRWAEVGVRVGRVGSVVVSLGDSVPLGSGRVPERSVEGRVAESLPPPAPQPLSARTRLSTSPASTPALAARRPRTDTPTRRSLSLAAGGIRRDSSQDVRIDDHLRIGRDRRPDASSPSWLGAGPLAVRPDHDGGTSSTAPFTRLPSAIGQQRSMVQPSPTGEEHR